jgi:quercetin dioxygenase-like cupin family protein
MCSVQPRASISFGAAEISLSNIDPSRGSNSLALGTQQVPVGGHIPIHRHAQMDEIFYVVEGSGTFILNDARLSVEKGATVFTAGPGRHVSRNSQPAWRTA